MGIWRQATAEGSFAICVVVVAEDGVVSDYLQQVMGL
jgi:hypothetical protein